MDHRGAGSEEDHALRYSAETQDLAYKKGAYDYLLEADMAPRMATIAAYIRHFGLAKVLDVGCGWGDLLTYLAPEVTYIGIDISETAVEHAARRFEEREDASFHVANFRDWESRIGDLDCVVWAGIGRTWTRQGRKGDFADWLEILELAERPLRPDGFIILEMVNPHWETLEGLMGNRYDLRTGCDIDHLQFDHLARRSIRVFQRRLPAAG